MCDTLCFRTGSGMVFAKNSDRPPAEAQVLLSHLARPSGSSLATQYLQLPDAGASSIVASHPTWLWGAEHGLNEHGVAIGNEKIWTVDDPKALPPALLGMDLVRFGLERGRTADEARAVITTLLAEHGQGGSGEPGVDDPYFSSFLIVDAHGGWVIETSGRTWAARPVGNGSSISNRISMTTDWTIASADIYAGADFDHWRSATVPTALADHRLAATRACVARRTPSSAPATDAATIADVVATLRDHGRGPWGAPGTDALPSISAVPSISALPDQNAEDFRGVTVCMHVGDYQATTASMVVDLRTDRPPRAWACLGSPCASVYVPFFPPAVPQTLRDPAQWQRFAALRDRVEADPEALATARAVLGPVEHELWADADNCATSGEQAPLESFAVSASARVDRALAALGV